MRAKGELESEASEFEKVLRRLGKRHEATHLATFPQIVDFREIPVGERAVATIAQVHDGAAVLYQPVLKCSMVLDGVRCDFVGEPDLLIREDGGYVICDVKMVRRVDEESHPEVMLQLQFYGWLYTEVFGLPPLRLEVFNGQSTVVVVPNDVDNVLRHLRAVLKLKLLDKAPYHPVGWSKCTGCGFHDPCWTQAKAKKDVALVLGVDQGLAVRLHDQGVETIGQLAERYNETTLAQLQRPWGKGTKKVGTAAGAILRSAHALLTNSETVLARPAIPKHDDYVMFDLEGLPPQFDELGKTYLWGMQVFGKTSGEFQPAVAGFGIQGDEQGWRDFLHGAKAIFQQHGDIPFVHWSPYERTQIREYVRRYGDPDGAASRVLKNLLDLLPITRDSISLPLHSYSLKEVEKYVGFKRTQTEFGGSWSMAKYIEATETQDETARNQTMDQILLYNKEDLAATWAVLQWLKSKQ
jgi:predicted RecB family nuclease